MARRTLIEWTLALALRNEPPTSASLENVTEPWLQNRRVSCLEFVDHDKARFAQRERLVAVLADARSHHFATLACDEELE